MPWRLNSWARCPPLRMAGSSVCSAIAAITLAFVTVHSAQVCQQPLGCFFPDLVFIFFFFFFFFFCGFELGWLLPAPPATKRRYPIGPSWAGSLLDFRFVGFALIAGFGSGFWASTSCARTLQDYCSAFSSFCSCRQSVCEFFQLRAGIGACSAGRMIQADSQPGGSSGSRNLPNSEPRPTDLPVGAKPHCRNRRLALASLPQAIFAAAGALGKC